MMEMLPSHCPLAQLVLADLRPERWALNHPPPPPPPQDRIAISRRSFFLLLLPFALLLGVVCMLWGLQFYWVSTATERVLGLDASERWVAGVGWGGWGLFEGRAKASLSAAALAC